MATIPLRLYNREIENLIDRGQTEEALAHCKYILNNYPKHIDTYRLLGKAYLETQRYTEAADILQRVLSVLPDDFVSQIGMSIIREDEGNLDAAIYHMKRAYEVQPSNPAIQEELRRLYGRRDGVEPARLRLTRGALVRMYYRGNLFRQAIAEIKAALNEEPGQLDLEVILAQCYAQSGQRVEATEVCSRLVSRLPYSYEANRILTEILPSTARAEDAEAFRERLVALDPYFAYVSPAAPTPANVNDNAVMIERLDWQPSEYEDQQPQWARAAGINLNAEKAETPPDWLTSIHVTTHQPAVSFIEPQAEEKPAVSQPPAEQAPAEPAPQADIPDWLRTAGWAEATGPEQPTQISSEEEPQETGEIAPAEMPDWLKSLAPTGESTGQVSSDEDTIRHEISAEVKPEDLAALIGLSRTETAQPETPQTWSDQAQPGQETSSQEANVPELPDWLTSFQTEPRPHHEAASASDETITEFLSRQALPSLPTEEIPEAPQETEISAAPAVPAASAAEESLTEWLSKQPIPAPQEELPGEVIPAEAESSPESEAPTMDFGISEPSAEAEPAEDIPEWLKDLAPQPAAEVPSLEQPVNLGQPAVPETPSEWLPGIPEVEPSADSVIPDWLKGLEKEFPTSSEEIPSTPVAESLDIPLPEEIAPEGNAPSEEIPFSLEQLSQTGAIEEPSAEMPSLETPDWLKALVEEEPQPGETVASPEETALPDWLKEIETPESQPVEATEINPEALIEPLPSFEIPVEEQPSIETPSMVEPVESVPDVLAEITPEEHQPSVPEMIQPEAVEVPAESVPSETIPTAEFEIPSDELPLPVTSQLEEPIVTPVEVEFTSPVTELQPSEPEQIPTTLEQRSDEAFTWLEGLAARQGAPEEELLTRPEDRREAPPDWVLAEQNTEITEQKTEADEIEPHLVQPVEFEPPAPAPEPLPEWLQNLPAQAAEGPAIPVEQVISEKPISSVQEPVELQPEAEPEEIPAWLEQAPNAPASEVKVPEESIPEWLKELQPPAPAIVEPTLTAEEEESSTKPVPVGAVATPPLPDALRHEAEQAEKEIAASVEDEDLRKARADLKKGLVEEALEQYTKFIQNNEHLEETIHDLRDALYLYPVDVTIWQTLGDAYFRTNRIQDAMDAYTKAEELLR